MEPFVGGLLAAAVAWLSIILVASLPAGKIRLDVNKVRLIGAITIALFGIQLLGASFPSWLPLLVFAVGITLAAVTESKGGSFNN